MVVGSRDAGMACEMCNLPTSRDGAVALQVERVLHSVGSGQDGFPRRTIQ